MAERTGATQGRSLTWMWMLLAVVVVAGFLTWLGMASEPSSVAIVEEQEENGDENGEGGDFTLVPRDSLAADKERYAGQTIRVPDIQATGNLGPAVFWGELGTPQQQVPILVQLDSALVAGGFQVEGGTRYAVTGVVAAMSDSVAGAWLESGVLPDEGAQMQATFADYYIEASNIRPARQGQGQGGGNASQPAADTAAEPVG